MKIIEKIKLKQENLTNNPPITIVFLGDSVTQGCFECYQTETNGVDTIFDIKNSFAEKFHQMLNLLYPSVQFNVINSGISGDSATGGLKRLERDVLTYKPDLTVVGFALNDSTRGDAGLDDYEKAMDDIVKKIKASGSECIVLTPNMMNTNTSVHLKEEIMLMLAKNLSNIQNNGVLTRYVEVARKVAKENGVPVCEIYGTWLKMQEAGVRTTELLSNKLNHPIRELHYYTAIKLIETIFGV